MGKKNPFSWQNRTVLQILLVPIILFLIFSLLPLSLFYFSSPGSREGLPTKGEVASPTRSIKINDFILRIDSIKVFTELIKDGLLIKPGQGNVFALVNLTFENVGADVKSCSPRVFLKDEENYIYPEYRSSEIARPFLFNVYPEEKRMGSYLFQIKKNRHPVEFIISSLNSSTGLPGRAVKLNQNLIERGSVFTFK
ncbi:MAG: DUF4352 domain-containing protein [Candidatus Aerophobetes bacterium]|nr:DUF4352 domain-containing protein [Candidatus Aerophobetes bacterium]